MATGWPCLSVAWAKCKPIQPRQVSPLVMAEAGVSGQESETMQGILVPAGTSKEIVDLLNREIVKAMALPDVKEKCAQLGFDPVANKPDEFAAYIKKEVEKWGKVIKDANIPQIQ